MTHAPIGLFIYNRPIHVQRTLKALVNCHGFVESLVYVFADGAKSQKDAGDVQRARSIAKQILGESATYRFYDENRGLAKSIIDGVSELTTRYGRVIIIEDDLEVSPEFLSFVNAALDRYADADNVMQVSGHIVSVPEFSRADDALFFPMTTTWGWGTWQRAWQYFDEHADGWEQITADPQLERDFNLGGAYDYSTMLISQMKGRCDSWGIRWYWSVFRRHGVVCFPPQTLVRNNGMDGSGTHGRGILRNFSAAGTDLRTRLVKLGDFTNINEAEWNLLRRAVWRSNGGRWGSLRDKVRRIWQRRGF